MNINFEEIGRQADITKVIGNFMEIKRKGKIFLAVCPFHDDHEPSLNIEPNKQLYKCFSCGAGGGAIKFVKEFKKCSYLDAAKEVIKICDLDDTKGNLISKTSYDVPRQENQEKHDTLRSIYTDAMEFYHYALKNSNEGKEALKWLDNRKVSDEQIDKFSLGYASNEKSTLTNFLLKKGYEKIDILKTNLTKVNQKDELVDFFWGRVIYPVRNLDNQLVGFIGRVIKKDNSSVKYLALPDTPLFQKSASLFNIENAIAKSHRVYIVEGIHDALRLDYLGVKNVVAVLGTLLSVKQLNVLKRFKEVVLLLDSDRAGVKASVAIQNKLLDQNISVLHLNEKITEDPDDYFKDLNEKDALKILQDIKKITVSAKAKVTSKLKQDITNSDEKKGMLIIERHLILCMLNDSTLINVFITDSKAWMISKTAKEILDFLVVVKDIWNSREENRTEKIEQLRELLDNDTKNTLNDLQEELAVSRSLFTIKAFSDLIPLLKRKMKIYLREKARKTP